MTDYSDLVKRLRQPECVYSEAKTVAFWFSSSDKNAAADRIEQLERALRDLIAACDKGRMVPKPGHRVQGMDVNNNVRCSNLHGVDAWAVEEARAALEEKKNE